MTQPSKASRPRIWWALEYSQRMGWSVFPIFEMADGRCTCTDQACGSPGKHPRVTRGFLSASHDPDVIRKWWKRWPHANVGIATGDSGLVVLDVDPRNGGTESLADLEASHGKIPHTVTQLTGGGGQHYLFRAPDGCVVASGVLADGLDIKARGGYIVAAPSNHASGRDYSWDTGALPSETPLATAPEWILKRLEVGRSPGPQTDASPVEGLLGAAFHEAGWLGRMIRPGVSAARCPWEDEHTGGKRFDSSTVIWGPNPGKTTGAFWCSHAHCQHRRTLQDVLSALPPAALSNARARLGLPAAQRPVPENVADGIPESEPWLDSLSYTEKGKMQKIAGNAVLLVSNLPALHHVLAHDVFSDTYYWDRPVPHIEGYPTPQPGTEFGKSDWAYLQQFFAKICNVMLPREAVETAAIAAAELNKRNPVQEYLQGIRWDGKPRLNRWLSLYLGVEETPYTSSVGRWWLISLVARALSPGCQADHMIVLEGPQGIKKSSALRVLGGDWYLGKLPDVRQKDASQALAGKWLVEIAELEAIRGVAASATKDYLSQTCDDFRKPYERTFSKRPRTCVFAGTTNEKDYLHDATGGRRFWPVACGSIDTVRLNDSRDNLLAETVACYCNGDQWWPSSDYQSTLEAEQAARTEQDSWAEVVIPWSAYRPAGVTVREVLCQCLSIEPGHITKAHEMRVASMLRAAGFDRNRHRENGVIVRRWSRDDPDGTEG